MENYHADYDELAKFIDALAEQKSPNTPLPKDEREKLIEELNAKIDAALLDDLSEQEIQELEYLLKTHQKSESSPADFLDFFKNAGIDYRQKVQDAMTEFGQEFIGGKNA